MVTFADSRREVDGRNRELRKLTAAASIESRKLFNRYIEVVADLQVEGSDRESKELAVAGDAVRAHAIVGYREAESQMIALLSTTSRRCALELGSVGELPPGPSYARFGWILAVAGSDDESAGTSLQQYLEGAATWFAESLIQFLANPAESSLLNIHPTARHSRMDAGSTRFRWICSMFSRGIDAWASEQGGEAAAIFGNGRTTRFAEKIAMALPLPNESVLANLDPRLIEALTSQTKPASTFARLVEGNGPEIAPLVKVDGLVRVGNASALVFGLETVLMAGVKATLGSQAQGDAFEFATKYIADELLPPSIHSTRDSYVSDTMTGSVGDEVDLDIYGKGLEVVVETKAHLPAKDAASAAAAYDELLKANKQVQKRVLRLKHGKWIRRSRVDRADYLGGLVVTLHDYSHQAWKPESMTESGEDAFDVLPIQAFAMALGCVRSPADFIDFLELRSAIGMRGVSGGDELEILLGWITGTRAVDVPSEPGPRIQFRPYAINVDSLLAVDWVGTKSWREYLVASSRAIHE